MRTTIAVDDNLLVAARARARERGLTLGQLVEEALRRELAPTTSVARRPDVPVFTAGTGVRAGVDVTSTRTLLESLDEDVPVEQLR